MQNGSVSVGTSSAELFPNAKSGVLQQGVQLKSDASNTGTIFIGSTGTVTAGTAAATDGFPLAAGQALFLPLKSAANIFAIASAAGQKLYFLAI